MRCDRKLCFGEKDLDKIWKDYVERVMNEVNDLDHGVEADAMEGPVDCIGREEVVQALDLLLASTGGWYVPVRCPVNRGKT